MSVSMGSKFSPISSCKILGTYIPYPRLNLVNHLTIGKKIPSVFH